MKDQAEILRYRLDKLNKQTKAISVISGKGGVGKSNFSLNFSIALSQKGKSVLLLDMDIGMGNIDILMGSTSSKNIVHFFEGSLSLQDVISKGPAGISYIAGGTGLSSIFQLGAEMVDHFFTEFEKTAADFDYIIFDMGAGISEESVPFLLAGDEIFVITTPEPTSVTDAYAAIKYLIFQQQPIPFFLICNKAGDEKEGRLTLNRLQHAVRQFLQFEMNVLGILPEDKIVSKSVIRQTPFILYSPDSKVSRALQSLINSYMTKQNPGDPSPSSKGFVSRLRQFVFGRKDSGWK
ncbi:flagellar biosynthesis protein FlhG [Peribacillus deserti]|uniref:Flagellar biosynthesis protein FlhG n=1 Tax=Peribacillus deserti TaxID=673318 RepID=A0ABS2QIW9_9BACI|nr:MinD/ParA family protein [Peribacillus deserti]MBM7692246.1 flagellar biosynthesis protein FlhG [Peribacillus deserti]